MTYQKQQTPWNKGKGKTFEAKQCIQCDKTFDAPTTYRITSSDWARRKYCSYACSEQGSRGRINPNRGIIKRDLATRFWEKVDTRGKDDCWLWTGAKELGGYGKLFKCSPSKFYKTHRLSWELHFGEIPKGMCVCHKCDTPACVNPHHLWLGTHQENMDDKAAKGREADKRGEKNGRAKLTLGDVDAIKAMREQGLTQQKIADHFGISQVAISMILRDKNWK